MQLSCGPKTCRRNARDRKTCDDALFVTKFCNQFSCGQRHQKISAEESKLHQHDLRIVELEHGFQMRNQNIIQASEKSPHKKDGGQHTHRQGEIGVAVVVSCCCRHVYFQLPSRMTSVISATFFCSSTVFFTCSITCQMFSAVASLVLTIKFACF